MQALIAQFGTAARAFDATADLSRRSSALDAADALTLDAIRVGARLWLREDDDYPAPLFDLPDPPPHLLVVGDGQMADHPCVAVVGTRDPSTYGERVARELCEALARAGASVVSGLARGIDSIAHQAALDVGGRTVAVLGTGIDVPYPAANTRLHEAVARHGLLLSEHGPGERGTAGSFPRRNRIIAALAQVTIVVEAGARSGALITASHALDLGRVVAAVPGPIDAIRSVGSNELLRDGAVVLASVADAVALVGLSPPALAPPPDVQGDERAVWEALARGSLDIDSLSARAALPARRCLAAVSTLELRGSIECALTGEIRRR